jgi:hypothetical protein
MPTELPAMRNLCLTVALLSLPIFQFHAAAQLQKPALTDPKEGAVFDNYPRKATFSWEPVQWASKYCIEIQCEIKDIDSGESSWIVFRKLYSTECHTQIDTFVGAQRGRWHVTAIDTTSAAGDTSEWRTFRFTK